MTDKEAKLKELYFSGLDRELDALRESVMKSTETFKKDCIEVMNFYKTVPYAVGVGYSTKEVLDNIKECQEMTDNEIIKALECCISGQPCKETKCPFYKKGCETDISTVEKYALDLINRQEAEIEKLKKENDVLREDNHILTTEYAANAKSEAIKEFEKRLKNKSELLAPSVYAEPFRAVSVEDIDNLVKNDGGRIMNEYKNIVLLKEDIHDLKQNVKSDNEDYLTGYISALSTVEGLIASKYLPTNYDFLEFLSQEYQSISAEKYVASCNECINAKKFKPLPNGLWSYKCKIFKGRVFNHYDYCSYGRKK